MITWIRAKALLFAAAMGITLISAGWGYSQGQDRGLKTSDAQLEDEPGKVMLNVQGRLTANDKTDRFRRGSFAKVYTVRMSPDKMYQIDLSSRKGAGFFDTFVRIEDSRGRILAENDDEGPDTLNSFLEFQPQQAGVYRVVVTTFAQGVTGSFALRVTEMMDEGGLPPEIGPEGEIPDVVIPPGRRQPNPEDQPFPPSPPRRLPPPPTLPSPEPEDGPGIQN